MKGDSPSNRDAAAASMADDCFDALNNFRKKATPEVITTQHNSLCLA